MTSKETAKSLSEDATPPAPATPAGPDTGTASAPSTTTSDPAPVTGESTSVTTDSDIPDAPPMTDEPLDEAAILAARRAELEKFAQPYADLVRAGRDRARRMATAAESRTTDVDEATVLRNTARLTAFTDNYEHPRVPHSDTEFPHTWAYESRWKSAPSGYIHHNTPQPDSNRILCWTITRHTGEPLRSSDLFYFQYRLAAGAQHPLPTLHYMYQQNTNSASMRIVYGYLRHKDLTGRVDTPPGRHDYGTEPYYALLGTENCSGPAYLVMDWTRELGITGISAIAIEDGGGLSIYFTTATTTDSSTTSASSASSSSSSSTSTMSKSTSTTTSESSS